jgi:3-keto-5-aminohexanoate cleavage enzyme
MGSTNFDDDVYINTLPDIRYWAQRMLEAKVVPECEIFGLSMINTVHKMADEKLIKSPIHYNFALGFKSSLAATPDNLFYLKSSLPPAATWGLVHDGMSDFTLLATAISFGASVVRVGFEDSFYYKPGKVAKSNDVLVKKISKLVDFLGFEVATIEQTHKLLLG